jgi:hypothetical protein
MVRWDFVMLIILCLRLPFTTAPIAQQIRYLANDPVCLTSRPVSAVNICSSVTHVNLSKFYSAGPTR